MPEVRLITPITRQSTKKMQVAAYCRVSSNSADQLNSYAAQIRAYKKCIGARDDWELVDIFADEGLTGMKSECMEYEDSIVRQMVECIKVYPGGKLEIIFGGGYLVEESV